MKAPKNCRSDNGLEDWCRHVVAGCLNFNYKQESSRILFQSTHRRTNAPAAVVRPRQQQLTSICLEFVVNCRWRGRTTTAGQNMRHPGFCE